MHIIKWVTSEKKAKHTFFLFGVLLELRNNFISNLIISMISGDENYPILMYHIAIKNFRIKKNPNLASLKKYISDTSDFGGLLIC